MSRYRDGPFPLALRASQAAAMLGISENQLRDWVDEGKVHKPYRVRKKIVLFDAAALANDWDRIKDELLAVVRQDADFEEKEGPNPWDEVIR